MLEGDGPLILIAHDVFDFLLMTFQTCMDDLSFPGVQDAIIECVRCLCEVKDDPTNEDFHDTSYEDIHNRIVVYACGIIQPAYDYLTVTIVQKLHDFLHLFRVAALVNPFYVRDTHPH